MGVFSEGEDGRFSLTPPAELLRADVPGSQRSTVLMMVGQFYEPWGGLAESVRTGARKWDADAVYKPYAIFVGREWLLWYNGRRGGVEQIGLATHDGEDLGF